MPVDFKPVVLRVARAVGLFGLARRLTRRRVRILAYHGFARHDEAQFRSKLFISPATFRCRLAMLAGAGYRVVPLDTAVARLRADDVEPDSVVITIDDGYASTLSVAGPLLQQAGFPATVYLTTYHMQKQTPVFDLAVAYMVWKSDATQASLIWPPGGQARSLDLSSPPARNATAAMLVSIGKALGDELARVELSRALGVAVGVDYDALVARDSFRLMDFVEARALMAMGVDIGLHTHRHCFPVGDDATCRAEIELNRRLLESSLGAHATHFCYPSGEYATAQWPVLQSLGVASATTCDTGLARPGDPVFGLQRFLDGESVSELEFEAELSGFSELLRRLLRVDRRAAVAAGPR